MRHLLNSLALVIIVATLLPNAALPQGKKVVAREIHIMAPTAWFLSINDDGSGSLQYGSSAMDGWQFKAGTFDNAKVTKALRALPNNPKGSLRTHFVIHFESERKGGESPPAYYTRDSKVIMPLIEKAIEAGKVKTTGRGGELLKMYPPGLPKEK